MRWPKAAWPLPPHFDLISSHGQDIRRIVPGHDLEFPGFHMPLKFPVQGAHLSAAQKPLHPLALPWEPAFQDGRDMGFFHGLGKPIHRP